MRLILLSLVSLLFASTALAECFPIRRIMDPSSRANFRTLCQAAVQCDPACQGIEPSKLINCSSTQEANMLMNTENIGRRFLTCARAFFIDSMVDLANTIIGLIKSLVGAAVDSVTSIVRFMTDSDFRARTLGRGNQMSQLASSFLESSARNFGTEYSKNFTAARSRVGVLNAPLAALGDTLVKPFIKMVTDLMSQIAHSQISQFRCLNSAAKQEAICAMAGGLIMPPAVLFTLLKVGVNGVRGVRGFEGLMTNARQTFAARTRPTPSLRTRDSGPASAAPAPRRAPPRREATPDSQVQVGSSTPPPTSARTRTRTPDEELRRVGALEDTARLAEAESIIGRTLTAEEKKAILDAHYIGIKDVDGNLLPLSERRGFGTYSRTDIRQKAEHLYAAGFSREEVRTLMERGIAGAPAGDMAQVIAEAAEANARRQALLSNPSSLTYTPGGRGTVTASSEIVQLQQESYVATRGYQRVARETEGPEALEASRRAIDASTTSMDLELLFESVNLYQTRGGDMSLLVTNNSERLRDLRAQTSPSGATRDEIFAREQIQRRYGAPEVTPSPASVTPSPVTVTTPPVVPRRVTVFHNKNTGEFATPDLRKSYKLSVVSDGSEAQDVLRAATRAETNAPLFVTVRDTIETYFDNGWPKKFNAKGETFTRMDPAEELRSLQQLNRNFFQAQVTNNSGLTQTLSEEYRSRAWGGNLMYIERAERNLHARIRELGGTP